MHSKTKFHICLNAIISTHKIIFSLLALSAYYELEFYSKSRAWDYANSLLQCSLEHEVKLESFNGLLENLLKKHTEVEIEKYRKETEIDDEKMGMEMMTDQYMEKQYQELGRYSEKNNF